MKLTADATPIRSEIGTRIGRRSCGFERLTAKWHGAIEKMSATKVARVIVRE
jgi:hypothetical protein